MSTVAETHRSIVDRTAVTTTAVTKHRRIRSSGLFLLLLAVILFGAMAGPVDGQEPIRLEERSTTSFPLDWQMVRLVWHSPDGYAAHLDFPDRIIRLWRLKHDTLTLRHRTPVGLSLSAEGDVEFIDAKRGEVVRWTPEGAVEVSLLSPPGSVLDAFRLGDGWVVLTALETGLVKAWWSGVPGAEMIIDVPAADAPLIDRAGEALVVSARGRPGRFWLIGPDRTVREIEVPRSRLAGLSALRTVAVGGWLLQTLVDPQTQDRSALVIDVANGNWKHRSLPAGLAFFGARGDVVIAIRVTDRVEIVEYRVTVGVSEPSGLK